MKRWALLTVGLYLVCLSVLTVPLLLALSGESEGLVGFFYTWFVPVLVLIQIVLLLVPIDVARERPVKRRKVVTSAVIGALPMAALALVFIGSIALMIWSEDGIGDAWWTWGVMVIVAVSWLVWGVIFQKGFASGDPNSFMSRLTGWLLRGSILGLVVAVPSHIISRHRDECCAPPLTLFGMVTGIAVALMSFGPGVLFLFARRIRAKNRGVR